MENETYYRWVKASERLPDDLIKFYFVRYVNLKEDGHYWNGGKIKYYKENSYELEWLCKVDSHEKPKMINNNIKIENERWLPVIGYEGLYEVSDFGRVKTLRRKPFILNGTKNTWGYNTVGLTKDKKTTNIGIHKLVAKAFIPNPDNKPQVNHLNGVKHDNRLENLQWCTHKENIVHAVSAGLNKGGPGGRGYDNANSKEVAQIDLETGKEVARFGSIADAAEKTSSSSWSISNCCLGKKKHTKGFGWKYI